MIKKSLVVVGDIALTALSGVAFGIASICCILVPIWLACQLSSLFGKTASIVICASVLTLSNPRFKHWDYFTKMVALFAGGVIVAVFIALGEPVMRSWGLLF